MHDCLYAVLVVRSSTMIGRPGTFVTIRYDTIQQKSLTWTRKLSIQLYLADVARKKEPKQTPVPL